MVESTEFWIVVTAVLFTGVGYWMGFKTNTKIAVERTVDMLIDTGYIKTRTRADGKLELLKHNEK